MCCTSIKPQVFNSLLLFGKFLLSVISDVKNSMIQIIFRQRGCDIIIRSLCVISSPACYTLSHFSTPFFRSQYLFPIMSPPPSPHPPRISHLGGLQSYLSECLNLESPSFWPQLTSRAAAREDC